MVSTRAMAARKEPAATDKENESQLALRKKPMRRAKSATTTTATTATATTKPSRKAVITPVEPRPQKATPLSPKKVTQVAKAKKVVEAAAEVKKAAPTTRSTAVTASTASTAEKAKTLNTTAPRPKRLVRAAAAPVTTTAPAKTEPTRAPVTRRKAALPAAARGKAARTRKVKPEEEPEAELDAKSEKNEPEAELKEEEAAPAEELQAEVKAAAEEEPIESEEEQGDNQQAPEPDQHEHSKPASPEITTTTSHDTQIQQEDAQDEQKVTEDEQEDADDESDDELCGPKTPMRRAFTPSRQAPFSTAAKRLQTPARRMVLHRTHRGTPQTQRVPLKAVASASPQRPMTVSRGANKAFVFHPLEQSSQSPVKSPEKTPSTPKDQSIDLDDNLQQDSESEGEILNPSPAPYMDTLVDESESEDELAGHDPVSDLSEEEEDAEDDVIIDEKDEIKESDYEDIEPDVADEVSDASGSSIDDSDVDDSIVPEPRLPIHLMHSSPTSASDHETEVDIDISEMNSSPVPSTPASVIRRDLGNEDSPADEIAPTPRLSLSGYELPSHAADEEEATPNFKSRVSFSTATAKMLQTPRMRFASGGIENLEIESTPSLHVADSMDVDSEKTLTINPSLLGVDMDGVELSAKLENAAAIPTPYFKTPARERVSMGLGRDGRMTLLEDDIMNLVNLDYSSPAQPQVSTPSTEPSSILPQSQDLITPRLAIRSQSYTATPRTACSEQTPKSQQLPDMAPTPPSYARSTFAFDARRQSMPAFGAVTPDNSLQRPRTADTTVKPSTADLFTNLWALKQRRASVRRSTSGVVTLDSLGAMTPIVEPLSVRKRNSTPLQPSISAIQILEHQASPHMTHSGAKPRRHTPTSTIKTRSPQKRYEAPRTPIKTPLKAPCFTPAAVAMTPHPSQPLRSVTALVEVFTLDGSSASSPFIALLQRLGARTTKSWSERVTHVVFKDGSPTTLQKVRQTNKETPRKVFCVNSRWVTDCDRHGQRMSETTEVYAVDVDEVPRGGRRRRKSMEPAALRNVDGNILSGGTSERRKSIQKKSLSRLSTASSFWGEDSPVKNTPATTRKRDWSDEDEDDEVDAFFNEPTEKLDLPPGAVFGLQTGDDKSQMTAPVDRVRKLRLRDEDNRRLTFLTGRE